MVTSREVRDGAANAELELETRSYSATQVVDPSGSVRNLLSERSRCHQNRPGDFRERIEANLDHHLPRS